MADWETLFERMMSSNPADWTRESLEPLKQLHLQGLCELMGIPYTGTKETLINRLLSAAEMRVLLKDAKVIEDLLHMKGKDLKDLCRKAGVFLGVNKRSSAASLLNWRNQCRTRGMTALKKARERVQKSPALQGRLKF